MNVECCEIKDINLNPYNINIFIAQLNVKLKQADKSLNSLFTIKQFTATINIFHRQKGDILVFPEYYLPFYQLQRILDILKHSKESNKIYIIPLSEIDLSEFKQLKKHFKLIIEEIEMENINLKGITFNLALIITKDNYYKLSIFSQFKTLPANLETKPHRQIYKASIYYIFRINKNINFVVPICFSFIGKRYFDQYNLDPLLSYIGSNEIDCVFVPQWNPKPLHVTFIKGIKNICDVSNGNTSIFMINTANISEKDTSNKFGRSSIVDLFTKKCITSEYDIQSLPYPKYRHLIFTSTFERLFKYNFILPKLKKNKLSPDFIREIDINIFLYNKKSNEWIQKSPQIIYDYSTSHIESPLKFSPEIIELRNKSLKERLHYICNISRESELSSKVNWKDLMEQIFSLTDDVLKGRLSLSIMDFLWIIKLIGEYHELLECNKGAYSFYYLMNDIACRNSLRYAKLVSNYLLMRICSRFNNKEMQEFAFSKASEYLELVNDNALVLCELGKLLPTILIESSLIISSFNYTFKNMYNYGSFINTKESIEYNKNEPGKQKIVEKLLFRARRLIEESILSETSHQNLHYIDVCCLTNLILGRYNLAEKFIINMEKLNPKVIGNYGCYLTSKHNNALLLQFQGDKIQAERTYFELIQEQKEYNGLYSITTVKNLSKLLNDKEIGKYLIAVTGYGHSRIFHNEISWKKAKKIYKFSENALRYMQIK